MLNSFLLMAACTLITDAEVADKLGGSEVDSSVVAADDSGDGDDDTDTDTGSDVLPGFARIPGSTFLMGCPLAQSGCDADEIEHGVTLSHDFYVGVAEVTQSEFEAVMGYNPSFFTACGGFCPVEQVTWHEAAAFANGISDALGASACYSCSGSGGELSCEVAVNPYDCDGYRLLTEAEWEGAARCGENSLYAGSDNVDDVGWVLENAGDSSHAVASLAPNGCGLYDMSGNVWEWTQDWYDLYSAGPATNPMGPEEGASRVGRGGGWNVAAPDAVVFHRSHTDPLAAYSFLGFRIARSAP